MEWSQLLGKISFLKYEFSYHHLLKENVSWKQDKKEINWCVGMAFIVLPVIYY